MAIALGALLPDIMMMVFYAYEKLMGVPERIIWGQHYQQTAWQNIFDLTNSIPIFLIVALICFYFKKFVWVFLCASSIIHCILDFWVHREDAHRHFYPFFEYRFFSPVSYWDTRYYGDVMGALEILLFTLGCLFLWMKNRADGQQMRPGILTITKLRIVILITGIVYLGFFYFVVSTWVSS